MADFLRVTFTGLNLFIEHKDKDQVAVLQPDCIPDPANDPDKMLHEDETKGIAHVGFVSLDLANVGAATGQSNLRGEGVYPFRGHTLDFGFPKGDRTVIKDPFPLPDFGKFAPTLQVPNDLMPTPAPLLRTVLHGGTLERTADQDWFMPQVLNTTGPADYTAAFGDFVTWTRPLNGDGLTLTITNFAGTETTVIPLKLAGTATTIAITIANVCSENPLGWSEFDNNEVLKADEDFKWLYRLLVPPKPYPEMLLGSPFPIPRPVISNPVGVENCIGGVLRNQVFTF